MRVFPGVLVWGPPAEPSGVITGYEVTFQGTSNSSRTVFEPLYHYHIITSNDTSGLEGEIQVQVIRMLSYYNHPLKL